MRTAMRLIGIDVFWINICLGENSSWFNQPKVLKRVTINRIEWNKSPDCSLKQSPKKRILLTFWLGSIFQVWFQNRRAKFRKQERLAQQKVTNNSSSDTNSQIKSEGKTSSGGNCGNTTPKDMKPGSPMSAVSTTPNSSASSHHSIGDMKPINGKLNLYVNIKKT